MSFMDKLKNVGYWPLWCPWNNVFKINILLLKQILLFRYEKTKVNASIVKPHPFSFAFNMSYEIQWTTFNRSV